VETSGVVEWDTYRWMSKDKLSFVVDYKLPSCGEEIWKKNLFNRKPQLAAGFTPDDTVKFVLYDEKEFHLAAELVLTTFKDCRAKLAFGIYWDGPLKTSRLVQLLKEHNLLDKVYLNVQLHKIVYKEMFDVLPSEI
jgi:hypothetical protein